MKYILILLSIILFQTADAQKGSIQISAQSKTVKVNLNDESSEKVLTINSKLKSVATGKLCVDNSGWNKEKDWKRTFTIYNDSDQAIAELSPSKLSGKYEVSLKKLLSKLTPGENYSLYTMAIPRDPKKAALVRVRRVFVCKVSIT